VMADRPALAWLALAIAIAAAAAMTQAQRLLLPCGVGLLLALFGTVLLRPMPSLAGVFLLLGFGALAGLVPLHAWLSDALAGPFRPGAVLLTLLANAPLPVLLRVPSGVLIAGGLASLLLGAMLLSGRPDLRRTVAFAGTAQLGMVVFAFGIGGPVATLAGWLHLTLLALIRAAVLLGLPHAGVLGLALVPLLAFFLVAGATAAVSAWLLLPFGAGALLTSWFLLAVVPPVPVRTGHRA
jgi:hydrogenase-4 component F